MELGEIITSIISFIPETYFGSKKIKKYYNKYFKNYSLEELSRVEEERIKNTQNQENPLAKFYKIDKK